MLETYRDSMENKQRRERHLETSRLWKDTHHQEQRNYWKSYKNMHRERYRANSAEYYKKNRGRILEGIRLDRIANPERYRMRYIMYREKYGRRDDQKRLERKLSTKMDVLTHYSGTSIPTCVNCRTTDIRVLTIDHVNGDGRKDRKQFHGGGTFYKWLKDSGYPGGHQTMCMNCQWIKRLEKKEYL